MRRLSAVFVWAFGGLGSVGFGDASLDIALAGSNVYITGITSGGTIANSFPLSTNVKALHSPKYELSKNQSSGINIVGIDVPIPRSSWAEAYSRGRTAVR